MFEILADNHALKLNPQREEQEIRVRDFAYEHLYTKLVPLLETVLLPSSSETHPHPLRSNPPPSSLSHYGPGLYPYIDRSITLTTPTGERITWVPRGQVVPAGIASTTSLEGRKKRKGNFFVRNWGRLRALLRSGMNSEEKEKGMGVKAHVTGRRGSAGFLRRMKSVFRRSDSADKKPESDRKDENEQEKEEEECRLCREDETRQNHEKNQFSNRNGEPLNLLAGRMSQFERFIHERAEKLMKSSFVGTPSPESSGVASLEGLEGVNECEHEELPGVLNMEGSMELVTAEGESRNGDVKLSTTEQMLAWPLDFCGRTNSEQQIGGLNGVVAHERNMNIKSQADDEELVNITFTSFNSSHNSSASISTSTSSEISRLLAQFLLPPNQKLLETMENTSNLELLLQRYPEAYAELREGQKEAFYAKELPLPVSTRSSSCDSSNMFQFASRSTIKDALHRWSTQATNRSSVSSDQELEADRQAVGEAILKNTVVPATPHQELQQKIQEAIESPLLGIAIPRPNSAEIDRRRKKMNLRLQKPFTKSLTSASSDFASEPSLSIMIEKFDIEDEKTEATDIIVGSPFVDIHEEYVAHPSTSFPLSPTPIGYPALDSSATLSEFGFHPTVDTMPGSWKQRWEMLDSYSDEEVQHAAFASASDGTSTPSEEHSSLILNNGIKHSAPMPIKKGNSSVHVDSIRRTASQSMFSRCRQIPGSFVNEESPTNSEYDIATF